MIDLRRKLMDSQSFSWYSTGTLARHSIACGWKDHFTIAFNAASANQSSDDSITTGSRTCPMVSTVTSSTTRPCSGGSSLSNTGGSAWSNLGLTLHNASFNVSASAHTFDCASARTTTSVGANFLDIAAALTMLGTSDDVCRHNHDSCHHILSWFIKHRIRLYPVFHCRPSHLTASSELSESPENRLQATDSKSAP